MVIILININEESKSVSVWVSSDEKTQPCCQAQLKAVYSEYGKNNYRVSVFISGGGSLFDNTSGLLLKNSGYLS